jgi:molybdopterin-guanine dinucleotide biosynthesis protein A
MIIDKTKNISGVILAGGENKRFGGIIKSNILIGGSTIISRIINTISEIFEEIIIVTNTPDEFQTFSKYKIVADQFLNVGPIGGIHSGMKASSKEAIFAIAGDMPYVDKELIMNQIKYYTIADAEALIPRISGLDEPLHGIYSNSLSERLDEYLTNKNNYAIKDFLMIVNVRYMHLPPSEYIKKAFTNINTPLIADHENCQG